MKKAMLSQPMAGKSDNEIIETREKAIEALTKRGYEIVNTLFTDEWYSKENMKERGVVQIPLCFLAKSLENMSLCHAAYFCKGWENARGCRIDHEAAKAYGLEIIYEEEPIGETFGKAIEWLKQGKKVARKGWNGKGQYVYYVPAAKYKWQTENAREIADKDGMVAYREYMALKTVQGDIATWVPSVSDVLAEDWVIVE